MTDVDSERVEDVENAALADVIDDSCMLRYIEIVPLDRTSNDDHTPAAEALQHLKQEPADDEYYTEDPSFMGNHINAFGWYQLGWPWMTVTALPKLGVEVDEK